MNKQEKQKLMIGGAIFKMSQSCKSFVFDGREFVGSGGSVPSEHEWNKMDLQFLSQKAQQVGAKEYGIIPPDVMALLMVAGEVLEFDNGEYAGFDKPSTFVFTLVSCGGSQRSALNDNWVRPCRVRQEPKTEKRWQWIMNDDACEIKTKAKTKLAPSWLGDPKKITKIEESAEDFEIK
jgi:hypothetical protein